MCALWSKADEKAALLQQKAQRVELILADAIDQRAKLNLSFESGLTNLKTLSASIVATSRAGITLEVSSLKSAPPAFVGAQLSAYFRVRQRTAKNRSVFLQFSSKISAVQATPGGVVQFVIERPADIYEAQQRRCVRVEVNESRVAALSLWRELPPRAVIDEHTPLAVSTNAAGSELRLANISTTGLRLVVKNSAMPVIFPELRKGHCFTLRFTAVLEAEAEEVFLVNAVLRNGFNDLEQKETSLGFEFVAERGFDDQGQPKWEPLRSGEVSNLGVFILKWNLQDFHSENRID
ncbi:PilZ domain-containing protein [Humidesulfovibrio sp.]